MAVKIRLTRMGRKKRPYYRIVAVDSRKKRDGAFIEWLGYYHPLNHPPTVVIDADKTLRWLRCGAQPTETVISLLRKEGIWMRFLLERKGLTEEEIQKRMLKWFEKQGKSLTGVKTWAVGSHIPELSIDKDTPQAQTNKSESLS
ncbi:MAG: 30S ribosomal protein S16 [bacterium]